MDFNCTVVFIMYICSDKYFLIDVLLPTKEIWRDGSSLFEKGEVTLSLTFMACLM